MHEDVAHCETLNTLHTLHTLYALYALNMQTNRALLCGSLRHVLLLLACMGSSTLDFSGQAGSSLARCLRFICIF